MENDKDIQVEHKIPYYSEDEKQVLSDYRKFSMMSKLKEQKDCEERVVDIDLR